MESGTFLTVGIGASAGGIKALKAFFEHVPADSGIAYGVVLHLSPDHDSQLAEILQSTTAIPVRQVSESMRVEPDHVYVIPPNASLSMRDGVICVTAVRNVEERRAPVDVFFRSLAESCGPRAVAVVLSGTGANGSMGMRRIREQGGICLAQAPGEAEFDDMPRHAIERAGVDHVLPAAEMPAKIMAYGRTLDEIRLPPEEPAPDRSRSENLALHSIFAQVRLQTGHDFSSYKPGTMLRRLARRMSLHALTDIESYARYLQDHPAEVRALLKDLLISVTNFFRDREAFETLDRDIIARLFAGKTADEQVRVWVAGCATGEEAYSLGMLLAERAQAMPSPPALQVFATDIDDDAIDLARQGVYTLTDAADVSTERLHRFFTRAGDGYRVRKELRDTILFAQHNLLRDPPFSQIDLVSWRNLGIYLTGPAQRRVLETLHFALRPSGYLFLGSAESIQGSDDLFAAVDKDARLFQKRETSQASLPLPDVVLPRIPGASAARYQAERGARERLSAADVHLRLLEQYAPPSIVIDEEHDIIHLSPSAGHFLEHPGGEPTHHLLKTIRPDLRMELTTALHQAAQQRSTVEVAGITVRLNDRVEALTLVVKPVLRPDDPNRGLFLVLFEPARGLEPVPPDAEPRSQEPGGQMAVELSRVRLQLRSASERHDTQSEELQAANEELQAVNEELRSSAEELETSKEELQSVNEELHTVNQELKVKVDELTEMNDDMRNLMVSTDIGTLFLDRSMRIKLFTPRVQDCFNLLPGDVGRPLSDITSTLDYGGLPADAQAVLERLHVIEREVEGKDGSWYFARLLPYRAGDDRIGGVVLTLIDITRRLRAEQELRQATDRLAADLEAMTRLQELSKRLLSAASLPELLEEILTATISLQDAQFGALQLFDVRSGALEIVAQRGLSEAFLAHFREVRDGTSAAARVMASRTSVVIEDVQRDPDYEPHRRIAASAGYRAVYATPLLGPDGELLGVLSTHFREPHPPSERVVRLTDFYAWQAARMIAGRREQESIRAGQERLRLIVEGVPDYAIFTLGADGAIESWNTGAQRIFGYPADEVLGRPFQMLFTPEDRERGVPDDERRRALETGRAVDERWHQTRDGSRFFASGTLAPLRQSGGRLTGFVKIARDLTDRKRFEDALRQAHADLENRVLERTAELAAANRALDAELEERRHAEEQIRALIGRLITAQEDERRRVARDLHDHLGQQVAGLSLKIDGLAQVSRRSRALRDAVEDVQQTIAKLDRELDFFTWQMRPPALQEVGLSKSLTRFVAEWSKTFDIRAEVHAPALAGLRLAYDVEANLYRVAQEALNNVYKHAKASRVGVILERRGDRLVLIIEDDGGGFDRDERRMDENERGIGLLGMQERIAAVGGTLEVESAPGKGTTVFVQVPIAQNPSDALTTGLH